MISPKKPQSSDSSEKEVSQSKIFEHLGLVAGTIEELETCDRTGEQIA